MSEVVGPLGVRTAGTSAVTRPRSVCEGCQLRVRWRAHRSRRLETARRKGGEIATMRPLGVMTGLTMMSGSQHQANKCSRGSFPLIATAHDRSGNCPSPVSSSRISGVFHTLTGQGLLGVFHWLDTGASIAAAGPKDRQAQGSSGRLEHVGGVFLSSPTGGRVSCWRGPLTQPKVSGVPLQFSG